MRPDGGQLRALARPLADRQLNVAVALSYGRRDAADALAMVVSGGVLPERSRSRTEG